MWLRSANVRPDAGGGDESGCVNTDRRDDAIFVGPAGGDAGGVCGRWVTGFAGAGVGTSLEAGGARAEALFDTCEDAGRRLDSDPRNWDDAP